MNEKPKWWEDNVDEMFIGAVVGVVAVFAIWKIGIDAVPIASAAVTALGMYIAGKNKNGGTK